MVLLDAAQVAPCFQRSAQRRGGRQGKIEFHSAHILCVAPRHPKWKDGAMKFLVTGSSGHLGEALMRTLAERRYEAIGLDIVPGAFTTHVGGIADPAAAARCMKGVQVVLHAATLHKPHVATHSRQAFINTNITGTLALLEEAARERVSSFIFTSTTS